MREAACCRELAPQLAGLCHRCCEQCCQCCEQCRPPPACLHGSNAQSIAAPASTLCRRWPTPVSHLLPAADWLLNHPNIDILEQQLLSPLIQAGEQEEEAGQQGQQGPARPLRVGLVTLGERVGHCSPGWGMWKQLSSVGHCCTWHRTLLQCPARRLHCCARHPIIPRSSPRPAASACRAAPCVSKYTLGFLRQMAFNLTEGQTYAGACALEAATPVALLPQQPCLQCHLMPAECRAARLPAIKAEAVRTHDTILQAGRHLLPPQTV